MSDKQERRSAKRIDCFDHSVLNANIKHSLVVDMSHEGAGMLVMKEHSLFRDVEYDSCVSGKVHLNIFHPDSSLEDGVGINAEVIRVDHQYSDDHCKLGVRFLDAKEDEVGRLVEWLAKEGNYFFHCEVEKL